MMKKTLIAVAAMGLVMTTSCSKEWLEDYKVDPTRPTDVTEDVLLTSAQAYYAMASGDVIPRLTSIFMQQMTGTDRQSLAHNRYAQIGEGDFNTPWGDLSYAGGMYDLNLIIGKTSGNSPHYSGVAKIMMAAYLGNMTDCFGDIPYSQAFQGEDNLQPVFDSQEDIYNSIFTLLDEGIAECGDTNSLRSPGSDDLLYGGDMASWAKFAYGLKARYLNHLSETAGYSAADVIAACDNSFTGGDDAFFNFGSSANQANPWYQFTQVDRNGYMSQFGYMYDHMANMNDPRIDLYKDASDSTLMVFWGGSATSPQPWMTNFELLFIRAEAEQRSGGDPTATLVAAISENMDFIGVASADRDAYVAGMAGADLQKVMEEKYVAMFSQSESWTDWRRTGYPALTVYPGANLVDIPRRLPYPQDEYLYNSSNVPMPLSASPDEKFGTDAGGTYKLWWDQ